MGRKRGSRANSEKKTFVPSTSPLIVALEKGDGDEAMRLLGEDGIDVHEKGQHGLTPLHLALKGGLREPALALIERGAEIDALDFGLMSPLEYAVSSGLSDVALKLLERGASPWSGQCVDTRPLTIAVQRGDLLLVQALIDRGEDLAIGNLLYWAVGKEASLEVLRLLLQKGLDPNYRNFFCATSPLLIAAEHGRDDLVAELLTHGACPNAQENDDDLSSFGRSALMVAAKGGNLEMVKRLLDHGAEVNLEIGTLLPVNSPPAISLGGKVADRLSDPDMKRIDTYLLGRNHGETALWYAVEGPNPEVVKLLLDHGAHLRPSKSGNTLIHHCVRHQNPKALEILISRISDPNRRDGFGWTPMDLAVTAENPEIIRILENHGATAYGDFSLRLKSWRNGIVRFLSGFFARK